MIKLFLLNCLFKAFTSSVRRQFCSSKALHFSFMCENCLTMSSIKVRDFSTVVFISFVSFKFLFISFIKSSFVNAIIK
uniref:Uncharacterized protein n=1 Tax=Panstrongylus lignarius TaxID=156445 RepID=A0A224Y028_9HEMI